VRPCRPHRCLCASQWAQGSQLSYISYNSFIFFKNVLYCTLFFVFVLYVLYFVFCATYFARRCVLRLIYVAINAFGIIFTVTVFWLDMAPFSFYWWVVSNIEHCLRGTHTLKDGIASHKSLGNVPISRNLINEYRKSHSAYKIALDKSKQQQTNSK